ncbi:MAG: DUF2330 domain-containing protein [Sedimentisphaerales bacterium]|nr:DUF2330 domain-containing protein [Sedimentisphaerales bacterium]
MKNRAGFVFLLIVICNLSPKSFADGRFYNTERIPDKIPYQRAFLIFHEGSETLILQSKYELTKDITIGRLGWIVPVPSAPEILSFDLDKANTFFLRVARSTQPKIIDISTIIFGLFLLLCSLFSAIYFGFFIIILLFYPTQKWQSGKKYCLKYLPLFLISLYFVFVHFIPSLLINRAEGLVDVIKSEQVGIYDVKVIKSDSENAIIEWLNENRFGYSDKDITVFKDYIEKQWCFVVAKIVAGDKYISRGMVAPLVLRFKTDKATYPLALTSLVGQETEVVIYTLTENKQTCGSLMPLKRSKVIGRAYNIESIFRSTEINIKTLVGELPVKMNLCKFKGILTPEQMKSDLVFESAADNEPYRETKIIW